MNTIIQQNPIFGNQFFLIVIQISRLKTKEMMKWVQWFKKKIKFSDNA
jgi:hypothetical protein